ncbi:MAG: winged helix-turn-helix domain-containing protein [Campylobacterota bacterium]|nr:winged helix-turn-helix domain-containing protein [Campylobacterota bacterium]
MIKKLRKFLNMSIMCLTDNKELNKSLQVAFKECKKLTILENSSVDTLEKSKFDILIIDYKTKNSLEIINQLKITKPLLPKIILLEDASQENITDILNANVYSILSFPVNTKDLELSITMAINQSKRVDKVLLKNGIYYDLYRERFYNKKSSIALTKYEFKLLKLLLDNNERVVSYDEIQKKVWQEKKMSIFTMRNVVNKIRKKTYHDIIINNSSTGYQIDTIN